jgi:hypothetical protein
VTFGSDITGTLAQTPRGGGGGSRDGAIKNARSRLYDLLLKDPDCLSFLQGRGANPLGTLSTIPIDYDRIGSLGIQAQTNNSFPDPGSLIPRNPSITINTNGGFFTQGLTTTDGIGTGTLQFQGGVLLHELGHATGVLLQDAESQKNQDINDSVIKQNCSKTLSSLGGK